MLCITDVYFLQALSVAADLEAAEQMEPVVCVTCSNEIHMRHALRHMEKCFQKVHLFVFFGAQGLPSQFNPGHFIFLYV